MWRVSPHLFKTAEFGQSVRHLVLSWINASVSLNTGSKSGSSAKTLANDGKSGTVSIGAAGTWVQGERRVFIGLSRRGLLKSGAWIDRPRAGWSTVPHGRASNLRFSCDVSKSVRLRKR